MSCCRAAAHRRSDGWVCIAENAPRRSVSLRSKGLTPIIGREVRFSRIGEYVSWSARRIRPISQSRCHIAYEYTGLDVRHVWHCRQLDVQHTAAAHSTAQRHRAYTIQYDSRRVQDFHWTRTIRIYRSIHRVRPSFVIPDNASHHSTEVKLRRAVCSLGTILSRSDKSQRRTWGPRRK